MRPLLPIALVSTTALLAQTDAERRAIVRVEQVWDRAAHSAFTGLVHWHGELWCSFREGSGHVPGTNGVTRILVERDGAWRSTALLDEAGIDLRDPKLSVTPDDRLMVVMGGSRYEGRTRVGMRSRVCFLTADGTIGPLQEVAIDPAIASEHDWLWRVTWHGERGYGTVYQGKSSGPELHLMTTTDGVQYEHVARLPVDGRANETTLRVLPDGRMVALVRREEGDQRGWIGLAEPPFVTWHFAKLAYRLGGPELMVVPTAADEFTLLAATRRYPATAGGRGQGTATMLARVGLDGTMTPLLELPSGGDTSYAGLVRLGDRLHVSYYSSHERRTAIYRAELRLPELLALAR